ncbi:MAG: DJ-1/PfpI family protein [Polyangiales bacterium]
MSRKRDLSRRDLMERTTWALGAMLAAPWLGRSADASIARAEASGAAPAAPITGSLQVAMVPYAGFTLLDLVGPLNALALHGTVHVVAATLDPVPSDAGVAMMPTTTFERCPQELDVLFVPGGFGTAGAMEDARILSFLRDRAPRARYVTSVCSGALVLAAAGLLQGYRATTHWATYDALRLFDVDVRSDRVVIDRNRMTGGGVTAGIDFGLTLLSILRDEPTAKMTQLLMEYAPEPPFDAGRPELAGPEITALASAALAPLNAGIEKAARAAVARIKAGG